MLKRAKWHLFANRSFEAEFMLLFGLILAFSSISFQDTAGREIKYFQEKGKVIDTVRCKNNSKFSYSLYLPDKYTETEKWPIIFVFDPAGRGKVGVNCFRQAAEKLGYIVVCSNDSRNRMPGKELSEALNYLFIDVEERFQIDTRRIYTSGFSGGSRVASTIALNNKLISGVIACGAGLPEGADLRKKPSFNYFGLVGTHDMNYNEMCELEGRLKALGSPVETSYF